MTPRLAPQANVGDAMGTGHIGATADAGTAETFGRSQVVDDLDACAHDLAASLADDLDRFGAVHVGSRREVSPASIDLCARALGLADPPYRESPIAMPEHEYLAVFRSPARDRPRDPNRPRREPPYQAILHQDSFGRKLTPFALIFAESVPDGPPMVLVDLAASLDTLTPSLRGAIDGRCARHGRLPAPSQPLSAAPAYDADRAYVHPLVVVHPRTGRKLLHLPRHPESTIEGLDDDQGREILRELWRHVESTDARIELPHASHDLIVWDNLRCLHTNPGGGGGGGRTAAREVWFTMLGEPVTPAA